MIDYSASVPLLENLPHPSNGDQQAIYIVAASFNKGITTRLINGCIMAAQKHKIALSRIPLIWVPGSLELAQVAKHIITYQKPKAIICLGAVIKGETAHFEHVCAQSAEQVCSLNTQFEIPVIFGVLTTYTVEQALARAQNSQANNGFSAFETALEMIKTLDIIKPSN